MEQPVEETRLLEVIERLQENDSSFTEVELCLEQTPYFSHEVFGRRLPYLTDEEFFQIIEDLLLALEENRTVREVLLDWALLKLLPFDRARRLLRAIGRLPELRSFKLDTKDVSTYQTVTLSALVALLEGATRLESLSIVPVGSLRVDTSIDSLVTAIRSRSDLILIELAPFERLEESENILDPLLDASGNRPLRGLSIGITSSSRSRLSVPLLSVAALKRLLASSKELVFLRLNDLGLNNDHCLVLETNLADHPIAAIDVLDNNTTIKAQGRQALLRLTRKKPSLVGVHIGRLDKDEAIELHVEIHRNQCGRAALQPDSETVLGWLSYFAKLSITPTDHRIRYYDHEIPLSAIFETLVENPIAVRRLQETQNYQLYGESLAS